MFTVEEAVKFLNLTPQKARTLIRLCFGNLDPTNFPSVQKWIRQFYSHPSHLMNREMVLCAANELLGGFGVEVLRYPGTDGDDPVRAEYVNRGESYKDTLIYDHETHDYIISCWGWFVEAMEAEGSTTAENYDYEEDGILEPLYDEDDPRFLRAWASGSYLLVMYDSGRSSDSHTNIEYSLYHEGSLIFNGDDIGIPRYVSLDSDRTVASVLHWLSLRPGDTDRKYFEMYTQKQLEWVNAHGEELWSLAHELRNNNPEKEA